VWGDVPVHPNGCRGLSSLSLLGDATAAGAWARTLGLPKQAGGVVGGRLGAVQINVEPAARAGLGLSALVFAGQDGHDGQHGQGRTLRFDVGSDGASGPPADS
jgi:hypothetical protein